MGCTVSGVERRNYERFVWCQEKSIETPRSNKSRQFSTCGKVLKLSPLKSSNKSNDLGKIIMLRTTDSGRKFVSKTFRESPRIKESSNSNENPRVTLFKNLNKELCAVDRTCNTSYLKAASQRCSCSDNLKVPWNAKSEKQSERNNSQHTSEAELGCNFQKDTAGNGRACFKFHISDSNNNPTNNSFNMPCVTEIYSCMQNALQVDIVKSDRVAVSVHERFFNAFEDDCDDDDFMLSN